MLKQVLRTYIILISFSLLFTAFPAVVMGDEIILDNGDRLTGTVKKLEGNVIIFETGYSEPIRIQFSRIKSIHTEKSIEMRLIGGEILKGTLGTDEEGRVTVESPDIKGPVSVEKDKILALSASPLKAAQWHGNIAVGANTQSGNKEITNITAGADASRKTGQDRYTLRFLYNYAKEDGNVSARNYYGAVKYDYFFTHSVYGYLGIELLKDSFKNLKLRTVVGPGAGYQVWDDPGKSLLFEAGISYASEDLTEGEDRDWITARLAGDLMYKIRNFIVFSDQLIMYPSLESARDFKLRNEAALTSPIAAGWSLKLANILEHDGNPPEDIERNDWYWILAVQYGF